MTLQRIHMVARFVHAGSSKPLADEGLRVRFYDADLFGNDFLGESSLSADGVAEVTCDARDFQSGLLGRFFDRLREQRPDIYCEIVEQGGAPVFRSEIRWNLHPTGTLEAASGLTIDLGTYQFRPGDGVGEPGFYAGVQRSVF